MDDRKTSISPQDLNQGLGSHAAPAAVVVQGDADFGAAERLVAPAFHPAPDGIEESRTVLSSGRTAVTYCFHGDQLSQGVAAALSLMGVEANFRERGIAASTGGDARCLPLQAATCNLPVTKST